MKRKRFDPARSGKNVKGVTAGIFLLVFFGFGAISNVIYESMFGFTPGEPKSLMPVDDDFGIVPDRSTRSIDVTTNTAYFEEESVLTSSSHLRPKVDSAFPHLNEIESSSETSFNRREFKKFDTELRQIATSTKLNLYFSDQWLKNSLPKVDFRSVQPAESVISHSRVSSQPNPSRKINSYPFSVNKKQSTYLQFPIGLDAKIQLEAFSLFSGNAEFSEIKQDINAAENKLGDLVTALNDSSVNPVNVNKTISPRAKSEEKKRNAVAVDKRSTTAELSNPLEKSNVSNTLNGKSDEEKNKEYKVIGIFVVGSERWALIENVSGEIRKYTIGERIGDFSVSAIWDGNVSLTSSFGENIFVRAGDMF